MTNRYSSLQFLLCQQYQWGKSEACGKTLISISVRCHNYQAYPFTGWILMLSPFWQWNITATLGDGTGFPLDSILKYSAGHRALSTSCLFWNVFCSPFLNFCWIPNKFKIQRVAFTSRKQNRRLFPLSLNKYKASSLESFLANVKTEVWHGKFASVWNHTQRVTFVWKAIHCIWIFKTSETLFFFNYVLLIKNWIPLVLTGIKSHLYTNF